MLHTLALMALLITYTPTEVVEPEVYGWLANELTSRGHAVTQRAGAPITLRWTRRDGELRVEVIGEAVDVIPIDTSKATWRIELSHRVGASITSVGAVEAPVPEPRARLVLEPLAIPAETLASTNELAHALLERGVTLEPFESDSAAACMLADGSAVTLFADDPSRTCTSAETTVLARAARPNATQWYAAVADALVDALVLPPPPPDPEPEPTPPPARRWSASASIGPLALGRGEADVGLGLAADVAHPSGVTGLLRFQLIGSSPADDVEVFELGALAGVGYTGLAVAPWLVWSTGVSAGVWRHGYTIADDAGERLDPTGRAHGALSLRPSPALELTLEAYGQWTARAITHTRDGETLWAREGLGAGAELRLGFWFEP